MNRFDKVAVVTAIIATLLGAIGSQGFEYRYYMDQMPAGGWRVFVAGWAVATYGPIAAAALLWRCAKRLPLPWRWLPHLLFVPCAVMLLRAGEALMASTIQDPDFDAMMDAPLMPAILSQFVAFSSYIAALVIGRKSLSGVGANRG